MTTARKTASAADIEKARGLAAQLRAMKAAGVSPSKIGRAYDIPVGAVDTVLLEKPPAAATAVPGRATQPAAEVERPELHNAPWDGPQTPWTPPPSAPAPVWSSTSPEATVTPAALRPPPSHEQPIPTESSVAGPWSTPGSIYEVLLTILTEAGVPSPRAKGLVRAFSHRKAEDVQALDRLLRSSAIPVASRELVLENWRAEIQASDGLSESGPDAGGPAEDLRRATARRRADEMADLEYRAMKARFEREVSPPVVPAPSGPDPATAQKLGALEARNRELEGQLAQQSLRQLIAGEIAASEGRILARIPSAPATLTRESAEAEGTAALGRALAVKVQEPSALRSLAKSIADSPEVTRALVGKLSLLGGDPELAGGVPEVATEADLARLAAALDAKPPAGRRPRAIEKITPAPPVRDDYPGG